MHSKFYFIQEDPNACDSEGRLLGSGISYLDTWKAMEHCVEIGLTKSIGLSNFNIKQVKDILEVATIKPAVNQVNYCLASSNYIFYEQNCRR